MTRIAVLSDIHGNIAALDAVLADIAVRGVDRIVNLGDICSGALHPAATAGRLMALDLPTIRGNHERQVFGDCATMGASDRHAADTLSPAQLAWLAALPATLRLPGGVLLVHGTPKSDLAWFLHSVTPDGLRPATGAEVEDRAGEEDAALILCGHTHLPAIVRRAGGGLIVNPGSVGLQAYADDQPHPHVVETGSPHARYAIVETIEPSSGAAPSWTAQLLRIAYDWDGAARDAERLGRPDWARALRTGRI